ncbi:MAG: hypothetical protein N3D16_00360 [Anaerolineales bacterium]|nr:hypothetical protein [Anaerolineales bacterium]
MKKKFLQLLFILALFLLGCNFLTSLLRSATPTPTTDLAATQAALVESMRQTLEAAQPTTPSAPQFGSIRGSLSYPSEFIPPLRVVAINVATQETFFVDTAENQTSYQIDNLPPGEYYVIAYTQDGLLTGGYTQMVPCGLSAECTDHSLIPVAVQAGEVTSGIDPADWYAPDGAFPPLPVP